MCGRLNITLAFRAVLAEQNSTSTLNFVPALAALNEMTIDMRKGLVLNETFYLISAHN